MTRERSARSLLVTHDFFSSPMHSSCAATNGARRCSARSSWQRMFSISFMFLFLLNVHFQNLGYLGTLLANICREIEFKIDHTEKLKYIYFYHFTILALPCRARATKSNAKSKDTQGSDRILYQQRKTPINTAPFYHFIVLFFIFMHSTNQ